MLFYIPQLGWSLETLIIEPVVGQDVFAIPDKLKQKNYSIALIRYWFIYHFLLAENANLDALSVCHLGNDSECLLEFIHNAAQKGYPGVDIAKWDLFEKGQLVTRAMRGLSAKEAKPENYDVIIFSALGAKDRCKEQYFERNFEKLLPNLKPNGLLVGVSSRNIKQHTNKDRISVASGETGDTVADLSPAAVRRLARQNKLALDFLSGGYFLRNSGLIALRRKSWFRFNLFLGAVLPSFARETYWVLRK
jgi:hypothetical protein